MEDPIDFHTADAEDVEKVILRILDTESSVDVGSIQVCHLPYQPGPYVIGLLNGADVWLRNDGVWSEEEGDPRNELALGGWQPPHKAKMRPWNSQ